MKRIVLLAFLVFLGNLKLYSQEDLGGKVEDLGYKIDCYEFYYPCIIYNKLISIIDSNTIDLLINKFEEDRNCAFIVYYTLNIRTGYLEEVIIRDNCMLLSLEKKEEFKEILYSTKFSICHIDKFYQDLKIVELYRDVYKSKDDVIGRASVCAFSVWWTMINTYRKKDYEYFITNSD